MQKLLSYEHPDLTILSGDQITGEFMSGNATVYYDMMLRPLVEGGYRWASVYGNHDAGPAFDRRDLMKVEQGYDGCYSKEGPRNITGVTNYYVPIYASEPRGGADNDEEDIPALILWFLDSNGNASIPHPVDW
ncbi:hypothetical protein HK104_007678, partial [Borealophlyctis nickersoniae]